MKFEVRGEKWRMKKHFLSEFFIRTSNFEPLWNVVCTQIG